MRRGLLLLATVTTLAATMPATPPVATPLPPGALDVEDNCSSLDPPTSVADPSVDPRTPIELHVRVLLDVAEVPQVLALRAADEPEQADAVLAAVVSELEDTFTRGEAPFAQHGITLRHTFDVLATHDGVPSTTRELIQQGKDMYGGTVPPDVDVVYVASDNRADGAAGTADCVGGFAFDHHSFASGDLYRDREWRTFPLTPVHPNRDLDVTTYAHEVAHLLGAHHHLMNCAEGLPHYRHVEDAAGVCTLMANDNSLGALAFSTANALVVRGYAEDHALDAQP